MTVESTKDRIEYLTVETEDTYIYDFIVYEATDMVLYLDDVLYTDPYQVTGLGDPNGGTVILDNPITAAQANKSLILIRVMEFEQLLSYTPYDEFPAESHEAALDRLTLLCLQLNNTAVRSITFPLADDTGINTILPPASARANKYLFFSADGSVSVADGTVVAPGQTAAGTTYDPSAGVIIQPTDVNVQLAVERLDQKACSVDGFTLGAGVYANMLEDPIDGVNLSNKQYVDDQVATKVSPDDYANSLEGGTIKLRVGGSDLFITTDGSTP